jgi:hypothetical protein
MRRKMIVGCLVLVLLVSYFLVQDRWEPVIPFYPGAQVITLTDYQVADSGTSEVKTMILQTADVHAAVLAWYERHLTESWQVRGSLLATDRQYGRRRSWPGRPPYTLTISLRPIPDGTEITLKLKRGWRWL